LCEHETDLGCTCNGKDELGRARIKIEDDSCVDVEQQPATMEFGGVDEMGSDVR
jgi:hypothetical protein